MPILPFQPDIFPPGLFELESVAAPPPAPAGVSATSTSRWLAFYTLARREKELMRCLTSAAIPFYAPLVRRRIPSPGGRVRASFVPLFPGYVFSVVDDDQRRLALATNTIARCIPVPDPVALVRDLQSIRRLITTDAPLTPESRIDAGHRVRVRSGPLRGLEGAVIRRGTGERLVVAVRFLNQGVSMELEDVDVERL